MSQPEYKVGHIQRIIGYKVALVKMPVEPIASRTAGNQTPRPLTAMTNSTGSRRSHQARETPGTMARRSALHPGERDSSYEAGPSKGSIPVLGSREVGGTRVDGHIVEG